MKEFEENSVPGEGVGSRGEGVGFILLSDRLPNRGLFLVAITIDSKEKSSLGSSSSSELGLWSVDSESDESEEEEEAPSSFILLEGGR